VYTQTLAHALTDAGCEVEVFAREEDPFLPDYHLRTECDPASAEIPVHLVNHARSNARFQNDLIDDVFRSVMATVKPEVVHFGHLNHLSLGLPEVAKAMGASTVFTLHDFWLMCPRGQFLQWGLTENEPWKLCDGQEDAKCASKCFNRFVEGVDEEQELLHWEQWVATRMQASRMACHAIDRFLAPSRRLMKRHIEEFGLDASIVEYLDYGFDITRLAGRSRPKGSSFVFGYIGRHHPSKGIHDLIDAFCGLEGKAILKIWGRPQGQLTQSLKRRAASFSNGGNRIEWLPEYDNENIVEEVFNRCDCIVVPSIWDENSPLVIHEAQQCGVPVITAEHGGMGEYVHDGVNGLTFTHRDAEDLRSSMQRALLNPDHLAHLGNRGYLHSEDGKIPSKEAHAAAVLHCYDQLLSTKVEVTN
jgi:glycosyltransferase involved in cell wall biosynthesis